MLALKHRVFELESSPLRFYWFVGDGLKDAEPVRRRAEEFAAGLGAENVVSIVEHVSARFTVVVWYREGRAAEAKPAPLDEFFQSSSHR